MTDICSFPDCGRERQPHGHCIAHRQQWRRHGRMWPLSTPGGQRKLRVCDFPDCGRVHYGHGLCIGHLQQQRKGKPLTAIIDGKKSRPSPEERGCKVEDCTRAHKARGFCRLHWQRDKAGLPLDAPLRSETVRTCDHCEEPHYAKGMCQRHYAAAKRPAPAPRPPRAPKAAKAIRAPRKPAAKTLPTGWESKPKAKAKVRPAAAHNYNDDSILWDLMPDHEWTDLAERMRAKLTAWGDLDLAEALGVAA